MKGSEIEAAIEMALRAAKSSDEAEKLIKEQLPEGAVINLAVTFVTETGDRSAVITVAKNPGPNLTVNGRVLASDLESITGSL